MVDLQILKSKDVSSDAWKKIFDGRGRNKEKLPEKVESWLNRLRSRIQDGRDRNFRHYKIYHAIDQAIDTPFRQTSATLAQYVADKNPDQKDALKAATEWGLTHMIRDRLDPKTGKKLGGKEFSLPVFFGVLLPIALGQLRIRVAKMVNDRNLVPYLKYEPLKNTPEQRAQCEIITDVIEAQARRYGYQHIGAQAILAMVKYGDAFKFIHGGWDEERQLKMEDGKEKEKIDREGLCYHIPHPTRTFYDSAYPPATLNTDTGCKFAGYWRIVRYGDLRIQKDKLWNAEQLKFPSSDIRSSNIAFFNTVYASCSLSFPSPKCSDGTSDLDREKQIERGFYSSDMDDSAVTQTEYFEKLIPSEVGLGDYKYPIWTRWMIANDSDVLWGEPLPGVPAEWWGYDPDDTREINASLVLEVLPTQDMISNLMSQAILTAKQNLTSLTFVNEDIVSEDTLKTIRNTGESQYRSLNLVTFSGNKMRLENQDVAKAFGSVNFPQKSTSEIIGIVGTMLSLLERTTGISAQEAAGQATHEQSAEEVRAIQQAVGARVKYTSAGVDKAFDAWKRQLYIYMMAYGDSEIYAQLPSDTKITPQTLKKIGFEVEDGALALPDTSLPVKGKKSALQIEYFSSTREGEDRINNTALAQAMLQNFAGILGNGMVAQAIGPDQAIKLFNQILVMMGFPRDFRLRAMPQDPMQNPEAQQAVMQKVQSDMMQLVDQLKKFIQESDAEIVKQMTQGLQEVAGVASEAMKLGQANMEATKQIVELIKQNAQPTTETIPFDQGIPIQDPVMAPPTGMSVV